MRDTRRLVLPALFVILSLTVWLGNPFASLDQLIAEWLRSQRGPAGDGFFILITSLADAANLLPITLILAIGLARCGDWRGASLWFGGVLTILLLNPALKKLFAIPRPDYLLEPLSSFSYPSGHSSDAALVYLLSTWFLTRNSPRLKQPLMAAAILLALLTALSRLYLGVHWLTDVIAGLLLGSSLAVVLIHWVKRKPSRATRRYLPPACYWLAAGWCLLYLAWRLPLAWSSYMPIPL